MKDVNYWLKEVTEYAAKWMKKYLQQDILLGNFKMLRQREYPESFDREKNSSVKKVENKNGIIFSVVVLETRNHWKETYKILSEWFLT